MKSMLCQCSGFVAHNNYFVVIDANRFVALLCLSGKLEPTDRRKIIT